jgi:hypothetical protein
MLDSAWKTHFEDLQREAAAEQRLVALGVRARRRPFRQVRDELRNRVRERFASAQPASARAKAVSVYCGHAAAIAARSLPRSGNSFVIRTGSAR